MSAEPADRLVYAKGEVPSAEQANPPSGSSARTLASEQGGGPMVILMTRQIG